jgi:hypothetical protein
MEGKWAIVNNDMIIIDIFEGDIVLHDISVYERYGGEVKITEERGEALIGGTYNALEDKFQ